MDPKVLIPENEDNHDVASMIYEGFQLSGHRMLPINIIENFYKNKLEHTFMKESYKILEQQTISHLDVNKVEKEMMTNQAIHFIENDFLRDNTMYKEKIKLKPKNVLRDVSDAAGETYALVQKKHLLKSTLEQLVDFRYNLNKEHNCDNCKSETCLISVGEKFTAKPVTEKTFKIKKFKDEYQSIKPKQKPEVIFDFEPPQIIFYNYEVNVTYKGVVKLRNISRNTQSFYYDTLPKSSRFTVNIKTIQPKLAPGMAVEFIINFQTAIYQDHCDRFFIRTHGFKDVCLKLICYRDPPILGCYLFRSIKQITDKPAFCDKLFSNTRRRTVNNSIDCGSVWVGESQFVTLVFKNKQQNGSFFLITHDEWYTLNIFTINTCFEMNIPGFKIFPAYFNMMKEGLIEMYILFTPQYYGLHTEELFFICNNNCFERIEIMGDGHYFGQDLFQISLIDQYTHESNTVYKVIVEDMINLTVYLGTSNSTTMYDFIVKVYNRSPFDLHYFWVIKEDSDVCPCCEAMDIECVNIKCEADVLTNQDITTFDITMATKNLKDDYNNIILCLFVQNIPTTSLAEDVTYNVMNQRDRANFLDKNITYVDVQILTLEFMTYVINTVSEIEEEKSFEEEHPTEKEVFKKVETKLKFSENIFQFGAVPKGIKLTKPFRIKNISTEKIIKWQLVEIKIDIDKKPSIGNIKKKNISQFSGKFTKKVNSFEMLYKIHAKGEERWVSLLMLMSINGEDIKIEDICIVCFEVVTFDITLHSTNSMLPVLCSMSLDHIGVPVNHKIYIHNNSPLIGCFCFLRPFGEDKDAVDIKFSTPAGIIHSKKCKPIECTIIPLRNGIFDKIYIPCFVAKNQPLLYLRIIIAIDNINVHFYLPENDGYFKKILWPPYSTNEPDLIDICEECPPERDLLDGGLEDEREDIPLNTGDVQLVQSIEKIEAADGDENISKSQIVEPFCDWIPLNSSTETLTSLEEPCELITNLKTAFGRDIMLHEYIVEVNNLPTKTLKKFTFYFENITPMKTKYFVESVNYAENITLKNNLNNALNKLKLRNPYEEFEESCVDNHGIVVIPDTDHLDVLDFEIVEVNIWIYANTWGIYLEEIFIEIGDIVPFGFSLVIEVVGFPIEWPFALNSIHKDPTLRLGAAVSHSEPITRNLVVRNNSSIQLHLIWHIYQTESKLFNDEKPFNVVLDLIEGVDKKDVLNLFISKKYYGKQAYPLLQIEPTEMILEKQSHQTVKVSFRPEAMPSVQTNYKFVLIGNIYISNDDKCKLNYFYRKSDKDLEPPKVNILAKIEIPKLKLNLIDTDTIIDVNVNSLLFSQTELIEKILTLRNDSLTEIHILAHILAPFKVEYMETSNCKSTNSSDPVFVKPGECVQIKVQCSVSAQSLQDAAELLYGPNKTECLEDDLLETNCIDRVKKIITCERILNIHHKGLINQAIPFQLILRYPKIELVPEIIKFGYVLVQRTKKTFFTVYNYTDFAIKFEIYKSNNNYLFYVNPHYGEIPPSQGINGSFINISVYFTPIECKYYSESLRICTNILPYFIELPISGYGINNEKFDTF